MNTLTTATKTQSLHSSALSFSLLHTKIVIINSLILLLTIILLGCLTRMPLHSYPFSLAISLILSLYKSHSIPLSSHLPKPIQISLCLPKITIIFPFKITLLSICSVHLLMAASGFEGFEKRLELQFSGDDPMMIGIGLRRLDFESLQEVLDAVQCTVVSAMGNRYFDAYVLSESSLFVYPNKLIIKTCGTTQLLKSIPPMLSYAHSLGLSLFGCRYTRGSFIFPKAQPFPHTSFRDEVMYLDQSLPSDLCYRKACVMPSKKSLKHSWHVYSASIDEQAMLVQKLPELFTIEVCMTELDQVLARKFYPRMGDGNSGDVAGNEMTMLTGINEINPQALICDFAFDPCGYSMNGIDGEHYSTIHVTPEDGFSYASFECVGSNYDDDDVDIGEVLKKVVQIFRPGVMSIALTSSSQGVPARARDAVEKLGLSCRSCTVDEFPVGGTIVFQTFSTRRK